MEILNQLSTVLVSVISTGGLTGFIGAVAYRKYNRKMKDLEAQLKSEEVSKARIESKADEWHIWKDQCEAMSGQNKVLIERNQQLVEINAEKEDRHMQDLKEKEERFNKQTDFLRGVQRDLVSALEREKAHIRREGALERERDLYKLWHCRSKVCTKNSPDPAGRQPPNPNIMGMEFRLPETSETNE